MDKKVGLIVAGAAALYFLTKKSGPSFYDMQGKPIDSITCGSSATFDVRGYDTVWLIITKDGAVTYDGIYDVPMAPYVYSCSNDVGAYIVEAYEVDANGMKGNQIGVIHFAVQPQTVAIPG